MESTRQILKRLNDHGVDYVVIGGVAAILHGSVKTTRDVDVCASLIEPNLSKVLEALRGIHPKWRMRPDRPPLPDDPERLRGFRHLYLETDLGTLDVLTEVSGIGGYQDVRQHSVAMDVEGLTCHVLELDALIAAKRAAGRHKDIEAAVELELIRKAIRRAGGDSASD